MAMTYIRGGKIVLPDSVVEGRLLAFDSESGKIVGIEDAVCEGAAVIDAAGSYVAPGLVDIHIHGYLGEDASDGRPEGLRKIANGIVKNGVTAFLPTTMTVSREELAAAFSAARELREESRTWGGAEILGVHAEGPFLNPARRGAQRKECIEKPNAELLLENRDILRIVTLAPEMDEGHAVIKRIASETDILLSMGHTAAGYEEAVSAVRDGVGHVTHLFNAMTPLAHREPGVVGAALTTDVSVELICDTFHIHPGLFSLVAGQKGRKLCLITDCTRGGGMPDGEYELGGQPIFVRGTECRLADGTIAGSVLTLNEAVRNLLAHTSLSVPEAVAAASLAPARAIGAEGKGALLAGYDADIIIADEDFRIQRTIKRGKTVFEA